MQVSKECRGILCQQVEYFLPVNYNVYSYFKIVCWKSGCWKFTITVFSDWFLIFLYIFSVSWLHVQDRLLTIFFLLEEKGGRRHLTCPQTAQMVAALCHLVNSALKINVVHFHLKPSFSFFLIFSVGHAFHSCSPVGNSLNPEFAKAFLDY